MVVTINGTQMFRKMIRESATGFPDIKSLTSFAGDNIYHIGGNTCEVVFNVIMTLRALDTGNMASDVSTRIAPCTLEE